MAGGTGAGAPYQLPDNLPGMDPVGGPLAGTYYGGSSGQAAAQSGAGNVNQANVYTPAQTGLQNYLPSQMQQVLSSGQVPDYFTAPPQVFKAYNDAFNAYVKPGLVASYGGGSPQIAGQQSMGNEQLAANLYQNGQRNYLDYLNAGTNAAFTPIGANTGSNSNSQGQAYAGQDSAYAATPYPTILSYMIGQGMAPDLGSTPSGYGQP